MNDYAPQRAVRGANARAAHAAISPLAAPPTPRAALRQLVTLRTIAAIGQIAAIVASAFLGIALPLAAMVSIWAVVVAMNVLMRARLRRHGEASPAAVAANLAFDLAAFSGLLLLSGGASNPFSVLYVLHAVLIALLLPVRQAVVGVALVVVAYAFLVSLHVPLAADGGEAPPAGLLAFGRSLAFVLTSTITAWFVLRIVRVAREQNRLLAESAQRARRDDAVMRVAALAAGAAHELATPLTTMAVVAKEIERDAGTPALVRAAEVLRGQVETCRTALATLLAAAGHARTEGGGREPLDGFLDAIAAQCEAMHGNALVRRDWSGLGPPVDIYADRGLRQAILALLDNAVDASPRDVSFSAARSGDRLCLRIEDRGPGVGAGDLHKLGKTFFTTKPPGKGSGLGLVLAARTVERLGGSVSWHSEPGHGVRVDVVLPLGSLALEGQR